MTFSNENGVMIFSLRKSAVVSLEQNIFDHDKLAIVPVGGYSAISLNYV